MVNENVAVQPPTPTLPANAEEGTSYSLGPGSQPHPASEFIKPRPLQQALADDARASEQQHVHTRYELLIEWKFVDAQLAIEYRSLRWKRYLAMALVCFLLALTIAPIFALDYLSVRHFDISPSSGLNLYLSDVRELLPAWILLCIYAAYETLHHIFTLSGIAREIDFFRHTQEQSYALLRNA